MTGSKAELTARVERIHSQVLALRQRIKGETDHPAQLDPVGWIEAQTGMTLDP